MVDETKRLGDIVKISSGGTPSKKNADYWNGDIPWISAKSMKDDSVDDSPLHISQEGLDHGSRLAPQGSILLLVRGSGLFNDIPICYVEKDVAFNQDIKCLESTEEKIPNKYIYYWLKSQKDTLSHSLGVTTIGAGKFDTDFILNLQVPIPTEDTIHKIVKLMDSITEKIKTDTKVSANLSAQLQAIFNQYFMDGSKPEWPVKKLGEFLSLERGLSYKGKFLSEDEGVPMINLGNILPNSTFRPEKLKFYTGDFKDKVVVEPGDIVVANTDLTQAREVLGSAIRIPDLGYEKIICSHHISIVRNCKLPQSFVLGLLNMPSYRERVAGYATGTTVLALPNETILNCEFSLPPQSLIEEYDVMAEKIYGLMENIRISNEKLIKMRNVLLPRVMSGEVDVSRIAV